MNLNTKKDAELWATGQWWTRLDTEVKDWESTTKDVVKDLKARETFGLQKYGKTLTVNTDEDMLQHLYEELLDGAVYIKTLINQRNKG